MKDFISKIIIIILGILFVWFITRPCSFKPFSKHDCYCEGFKKGYGKYPINCGH